MPAPSYIPITGSTGRLNSQCRQYIDVLRQVLELGTDLKNAMAQAAGNQATFAVNMGFTNDQAGLDAANAVQAVLASSATDIAASGAVAQAISRFF